MVIRRRARRRLRPATATRAATSGCKSRMGASMSPATRVSRCATRASLREAAWDMFEVVVDESDRQRPWPIDLRQAEISAGGQLPGIPNRFRGGAEVSPLKVIGSVEQAILEALGLECGDRHALAVNGIEAADRVADGQQTSRPPTHLVVSTPASGGHPMLSSFTSGLAGPHRLHHMRGSEIRDECQHLAEPGGRFQTRHSIRGEHRGVVLVAQQCQAGWAPRDGTDDDAHLAERSLGAAVARSNTSDARRGSPRRAAHNPCARDMPMRRNEFDDVVAIADLDVGGIGNTLSNMTFQEGPAG